MSVKERFLNYISIETESDELNEEVQPSSESQWKLAGLLEKELRELGADDVEVSKHCIVYAHFNATEGLEDAPAFGCIAHMDTVLKGKNIKPQVIENYDGKPVTLANGKVLGEDQNPHLADLKGRTLIVTDGNTILGADDKAGVASIMNLCEKLQKDGRPHGKICVAFTPDEEIGHGVDNFDLAKFGADYAVTVDGGAEWEIEYENFNAAGVTVRANGVNTHPGSAKGVMINSAAILCEYQSRLPKEEVPEKTENKEGFYHLLGIRGDVDHTEAHYLIREFDRERFEKRKAFMSRLGEELNREWGRQVVTVEIKDSYYNMAQIVEKDPVILGNIETAIERAGLAPRYVPIRGGTDGCRLSFEGLPCPNIGAGGYLFHSIFEHCTVEGMENATRILLELVKLYAESGR
ncbi:MAG: peptidase T [Lachnospiraceae bacterium]|jgi:tripeptide aminopeptidase|nr:peptidase T [Lachnospiraceae bacterium]